MTNAELIARLNERLNAIDSASKKKHDKKLHRLWQAQYVELYELTRELSNGTHQNLC